MSVSIAMSGADQAAVPIRPRPRLHSMWPVVALSIVAALGAAGFVLVRRHAADREHYVTAPVTRGSVIQAVNSSGTVNPVTIVQV